MHQGKELYSTFPDVSQGAAGGNQLQRKDEKAYLQDRTGRVGRTGRRVKTTKWYTDYQAETIWM